MSTFDDWETPTVARCPVCLEPIAHHWRSKQCFTDDIAVINDPRAAVPEVPLDPPELTSTP